MSSSRNIVTFVGTAFGALLLLSAAAGNTASPEANPALSSAARRIVARMGDITATASGQSNGIGQVDRAVSQLDQLTRQDAALRLETGQFGRSIDAWMRRTLQG